MALLSPSGVKNVLGMLVSMLSGDHRLKTAARVPVKVASFRTAEPGLVMILRRVTTKSDPSKRFAH